MTSTLPPLVQALSGAVGSASASTLTYPLDLITTRMQLDSSVEAKRPGGVKGGLRLLLLIVYGSRRKQTPGVGWRTLYDGLHSDLVATMLSNFFYFYFYSYLRSMSIHGLSKSLTLPFLQRMLAIREGKPDRKPHRPTLVEDLILGFVAGVASRAISTPLNIITLRIQEERVDEEDEDVGDSDEGSNGSMSPMQKSHDTGIIDIARLIYEESGLQGFWKGFGTSALLSINPSITLAFFQLFRKVIVYSRNRGASPGGHISSNLKPMEAFFVGAIANSIASSILYPLILSKKRLQSGAGTGPNATLFDLLRDAYLGQYDPHEAAVQEPNRSINQKITTLLTQSDSSHLPTRPRTRRSKSSRYYDGSPSSIGPLSKAEGLEGLYQGLQMQILKGFFNQGVTFLVKGRIEQLVVAAYLRRLGK